VSEGLQILGGGAHPPAGVAGGDLTGNYPNPTLAKATKEKAPQLLVAGEHIEAFSTVEMPGGTKEVEFAHGLPKAPINVQLTVLDAETLEPGDYDVTLKVVGETKVTLRRPASVKKVVVHWRAIT
jgi:hypothetical protein